MQHAGCRELAVGVESGDQDVLDTMLKGTRVEQARDAVNMVFDAGIHPRVLMMVGTPGETTKTVGRNIAFLEPVRYGSVSLTQFVPFPGCAVWHNPELFGCRIVCDDFDNYNIWSWDAQGMRSYVPLVEVDTITPRAMERNVRDMRAYVLKTGKMNEG